MLAMLSPQDLGGKQKTYPKSANCLNFAGAPDITSCDLHPFPSDTSLPRSFEYRVWDITRGFTLIIHAEPERVLAA